GSLAISSLGCSRTNMADRDARSSAETRRELSVLPDDCLSSEPSVSREAQPTLANSALRKLSLAARFRQARPLGRRRRRSVSIRHQDGPPKPDPPPPPTRQARSTKTRRC